MITQLLSPAQASADKKLRKRVLVDAEGDKKVACKRLRRYIALVEAGEGEFAGLPEHRAGRIARCRRILEELQTGIQTATSEDALRVRALVAHGCRSGKLGCAPIAVRDRAAAFLREHAENAPEEVAAAMRRQAFVIDGRQETCG